MKVRNMNLWELGYQMLSLLEREEYEAVEAVRLEIKRRIDDGTVNDALFQEMITSHKFSGKIDPICFFND